MVVALVAGRVLVPRSKDPDQAPLHPRGAGLSIVGLGVLLYAIIEAPVHGLTDPRTLTAAGVAVVVLALFAWWELRAPSPMLDLRLFRDRRFSAARRRRRRRLARRSAGPSGWPASLATTRSPSPPGPPSSTASAPPSSWAQR